MEDPGIHHLHHVLVEFCHLGRVDIFGHVAALEESFNASHLFNHLSKLSVLLEQFLDHGVRSARSHGHSCHPAGLPREQLGSLWTVQLWTMYFIINNQLKLHHNCDDNTLIIHAVHDGHELLQLSHRLLLIAFRQEVISESRNHVLRENH